MESICFFKDLSKADVGQAGGKGASLGEMTRAGIPVPPGFVVTASAFERFLEETDLNIEIDAALKKVRHQEMESVERASENIQAMILAAAFPKDLKVEIVSSFKKLKAKYVAVRSSATSEDSAEAAWAGQLDSYLNTTDKQLLKNVQRCWASLFTPRAIFYRFEKGLHKTKISVAVVVQKMVQSESSGIAFSVHPVTEDYNQLIVEAGFGLGEAIVSGQVTPDSYVVDKKAGTILDTNVSTQDRMLTKVPSGGNKWVNIPAKKASSQVLTNKEVLQMAAIVQNIEKHYGFPVDVEWAREGKNFYVVQSRPITTLKKAAPASKPSAKAKSAAKHIKKNLKNSSDSIRLPSGSYQLSVTRTCSLWHDWHMSIGNAQFAKAYGLKSWANVLSVVRDGVLTSHFFEDSSLARYSADVLAVTATASKRALLKKRYEQFGSALLSSVAHASAQPTEKNILNFYRDYQRLGAGLFLTAILGRSGTAALQGRLRELDYPEVEVSHAVAVLSYPHDHTPLFESQLALLRIGAQVQQKKVSAEKVEKFLNSWVSDFGVIPVNYCGNPWTMKDAQVQLASVCSSSCAEQLSALSAAHAARVKERSLLLKKLADQPVTELADTLAVCTTLNEYRKNIFCRTSLAYRPLFVHVASLAGSSDWKDCFYLTPDEMLARVKGLDFSLAKIKSCRRISGCQHTQSGGVEFVPAADLRTALSCVDKTNGKGTAGGVQGVSGFAAGKGSVTGTVRIVLSDRDFHKVKRGDILVAPMTSVDYVPVMELAAAFVTNEGGVTSHASIVAREMGKPCVIGTKNATQVLKDGDRVTVDGGNGTVTILKKKE